MIRAIPVAVFIALLLTACGETESSTDKKVTSASTETVAAEKAVSLGTETETAEKAEKEPVFLIMGESRDGEVILDDTSIASADVISYDDAGGSPYYGVLIKLDDKGKEKFAKTTRQNIGKKISLWIGEECVFSPTVANEITDGKVVISEMTYEEAMQTAERLS